MANAAFNNSSGTVRFNSTAGSETIAMGTTSNFATLEFNSASGNFTVIENATATAAINLTSAISLYGTKRFDACYLGYVY